MTTNLTSLYHNCGLFVNKYGSHRWCGGASGREGCLKLRDDVVGNAAEGTGIGGRAGHDEGASFSRWMAGIMYEYGRGKRGGFIEK